MERLVKTLLLFLLSFAIGCGDGSTFNKEETGTSASRLINVPNGLAYPLSSMSSWTNANYGACGSGYYFTGKCHNGADILAAHGTPVYAITAGTVVVKSATQDIGSNCYSSGWGYDYEVTNTCNMGLLIRHYDANGDPFVSVYGHLRLDPNVHVGTTFTAGQQIGVIGRWYNTNGTPKSDDHLHWGIYPAASPPLSGYGAMPCSVSQPASSTFPQGCSTNGFVPPGTFIATHFPQETLFDHHDPPTVCANQPSGDASTNWYYTCNEKGVFQEGDHVWVLLRLHDVDVNHRFRVKAYKDNIYQWDWTTNVNDVGSGGWQYSHFWPELMYALPGEWKFDLYFVPEEGTSFGEMYVDSASFTVHDEHYFHISTYSGESFDYDGNGYTCPGPVAGGESTNWDYTCGTPQALFEQGETVYGLVRLNNITSDFRFSFDVYKDGAYQWNYVGGWEDVGEWGWSKTYYAPMLENAQPGNWDFYISVDDGTGFSFVDSLSFVVSPNSIPYEYNGSLATCRGPVSGGAETNWVYTCENPTSSFNTGDVAYALVRIDDVMSDHRWKEEVYINGSYQWNWTTDWFDVGEWGWSMTYFAPYTSSVWPGNWEYRIYVDVGSGFQYLDSAYFTVN